MSDKAASVSAGKVTYRVKKPVFVNGSLVEPMKGRDVFVEAAPGLDGSALEAVNVSPAKAAEAKAAAQKPK